jgi:site-specific DNA recombinase
MKTAAIYARYSSDLQRERSIDDPVAHCRTLAERHGYKVAEVFIDRKVSGESMFERDGLLALMQAAKNRSFDAVIVESLSRLSRDQADMPAIHKRLKFNDITIIDTTAKSPKFMSAWAASSTRNSSRTCASRCSAPSMAASATD